jgi:type IV pilus assembly protein PilQ
MFAGMSSTKVLPFIVVVLSLVGGGMGCRQVSPQTARSGASLGGVSAAESKPKVRYSPRYDAEIENIMELARRGRWEEAREEAEVLLARAPDDPAVQRVHSWVQQQQQAIREKALEDKIREINAANSVFNPTIPDLLTEKKDRGLTASKDVRDTIEKIESSRLIPESYGVVRREKGPLFDLEAARGPMAKILDKEVTIHLDNVTLENLIIQLSQTAGINIVADKSLPVLKQTLSVNLEKVRLAEFLKFVSRNYEIQFQVGPELIWVTDAKDPKKLMEETRFYRLRTGFVRPARLGAEEAIRTETRAPNNVVTVTETQKFRKFVNDEAPEMPSIEQAITNLFTGSKWFIDYERNLIVARGTPEQLEVMEKIIEEFDRPIQQVLIEARFVTISKPAFLQLGALWETGRATQGPRVPQDFTGLASLQSFPSVNNVPAVGIGLQEVFTNILGRRTLSATLSALEQSGESQTLSAPRLTVLNNRPATISDGKVQYYYEEYQVKQTVQQYYTASSWVPSGRPTKVTAGAELNVLASIAGDGKHIILALNPRVNTDVQLVPFATLADYDPQSRQVLNSFTLRLPEYRTQELATRVVVRSGETVVMGGVLERERVTMVEAVPVLGNIPVLGAAFRRRTEVDKPRYLLIFVTATIVNEKGEYVIYED